jgi:HPt (histidine-containing phosphotransfer) domain-containing protein
LTAAIRREEAIRQNGTDPRRIPILALSANALRGEAERARSFGVDMYLTKPILLPDLHAALATALAAAPKSTGRTAPAGATAALPVFDVCTLIAYVGDETDALEGFLARFTGATAELVGALREALASRDPDRVRGIVHNLKSLCRFVGAFHVAAICERLERFGCDSDLQAIAQEMPAFNSGWAELGACIADHLLRARSAEAGDFPWQR